MVLGDSSVGKTSLIERFTKGEFSSQQQATVGLDYRNRTYKLGDKNIRVQIWDTAGQEIYRSLAAISIRDADGILLVYDRTNEISFQNIEHKWLSLIQNSCKKEISVALLANKVDLDQERTVSREDGEKLAAKHSASFFETSAKKFVNVEEAFEYLVRDIYGKIEDEIISPRDTGIQLESKKKTDCCECNFKESTGKCW